MHRMKEDKEGTLSCPNYAYDLESGKGLVDMWGEELESIYLRLESEKKGRKTVEAQQLWFRHGEDRPWRGNPHAGFLAVLDEPKPKDEQEKASSILRHY